MYNSVRWPWLKVTPVPGGGLVVATIRSGALVLSPQGKLLRILNEDSGLPTDSVTFVHPDREGGLWLAMAFGVGVEMVNIRMRGSQKPLATSAGSGPGAVPSPPA